MNIINIKNTDIISTLKQIINKLNIINYDGMCEVYTSLISEQLTKENILNKVICTNDLDITYKHYFILIPYNEDYILVDPTYQQFEEKGYLYGLDWYPSNYLQIKMNDKYESFILEKYMIINNEEFNYYLFSLSNIDNIYDVFEVYMNIQKNKLSK